MSSAHDARLVRRAAWTVSVQTALAVALVVVVVAVGVVVLFDRQQASQIEGLVQRAATTADDVTDPPEGVWLVRIAGSRRTATPGAPAGVVQSPQLVTARPGMLTLDGEAGHLAAWVSDRAGTRYVAVYDQSRHRADEQRLLVATTLAGLVGVLLAGAIGLLVGRQAVRPLGQALALQRRFVADASHELRTPLAVLHTRAQMVRRHLHVGADASQRDEIDQLVTDTASLGEVVADLLLAAQLEHASVPATEVDLRDLAREVVASMGPYAENAGVRLEVVLRDDAPEGEFVVNGAPTALRRALTALVDNAIAHSEVGGQVHLRLRSQPGSGPGAADRHGTVWLTVQDDGEGLDPAEADTLTQRFARGTSTSSGAGRRFGLGLALVDEVVRAHDGSLEIDGSPGVGSSFTLRLPRADPLAPA